MQLIRLVGAGLWFRGVVPELSGSGRQRVLEVLVTGTTVTDHRLKVDHRGVRLSEMGYEQLSDVVKRTSVPDAARGGSAIHVRRRA